MSDLNEQKTYGVFANPAARKIIAGLEAQNADIRLFPPIEFEKIILGESEIEVLQNLTEFDWLFFTDTPAVDYFLENLSENAIDSFELDALRICAVGETVADQLRFSSIHSDVVPTNFQTENILSAIENYVGAGNFEKIRILFPKEISTVETITAMLGAKGVVVREMPVYAARFKNDLEIAKLKTLVRGGAIDEFVFTAPTDFIALKHYLKTADLAEIFAATRLSAADGLLMQAARENNLPLVNLFHLAKN